MQKDNYSLLIEKLDGFIRKFYLNQLMRGALYAVGAVLGLFVVLNVLEYYFYFSTSIRTFLLWSFLVLSGLALYTWVAVPLMHYFHLGKVISHEQAATIIGSHFTNVKDKLLNILQLKQQSHNAIYAELITASINQKSDEIKLVPFKAAIDLKSNRKYLRYALPPLLLLLFLMCGAPNILREASFRLWNSTTAFERPAPFRFLVNPDSLHAVQFSDYVLNVLVEGQALPNDVYIAMGEVQYRLTKEAPNKFSFRFANVQADTEFKLFSGYVESRDYVLDVVEKPNILSFEVALNFPDYIGRTDEQVANVGDLVVPAGTQIQWAFNVQHTDAMGLRFGTDGEAAAKRFDEEGFSFSRRAMRDERYVVFLRNAGLPQGDSVTYTISVIPDEFPKIGVQEFRDSTNTRALFFAGDASDDYGLNALSFNYQVKKATGGQMPMNTVRLEKTPGKQTQFNYTWDLRNIDLQPGDEITYYFEIFDNDGVNGAKSARTSLMQFKMPSMKELREQQAENSEEIKKELEAALKESQKVQEEMKKLRNKILQQKELDWQSRKELERLLNRQKELQQQIQNAQQKLEQNNKQQEEFSQQSEELKQKQEQLEKLMEEAVSEEMKQLMEDIQKLLQEMQKDEALEKMEEMQMSNEKMNKELERLKELYKQLEVENLLEQQIEQMEELAKEQEELAEKTEKQEESNQELDKKQEELNKKMEELEKQQKELKEKNEQLKRPQDIEDNKPEMDDIQKDMEDAEEQIEQNQNKNASKKQKSAANKMRNSANKMKQKKQQGQQKQLQEDIATLRQLLENLVSLSFDQEENLKDVSTTTVNTPRYVELAQEQYKIRDDFKLVEDSLQALASRNFQIESIITEKVTEIKSSLKTSVDELEERHTVNASEQQQRSMKGLNDLALLLSDALQNMQMQMNNSMPGSGSCPNPGNSQGPDGKKPKDKISKGQGNLNEQMKQLKERLEKGQGQGEGGMAKEFAKMAAQQAALRNALRKLQQEKQEQGKGSKALEELQKEMDKVETDLVNKRLTNETLRRQQEILTRLLEEERAEREQEQDEKRQAEQARQQQPKMPPALEEYLKKRRAEVDQYRTVSPALKPYYKQLVEEYLKSGN